ncbi:MAG: PP0621 family protein [Rubrivivax sp.]|jgi:uncharacterized protein|nr:hypothetical protein [Rubrivivax sp.]
MGRVVILVLLLVLVVAWVGSRIRRARRARAADGQAVSTVRAATGMVRCAHCGLHLPAQDALTDGQRNFCGEEHRRLGAR